MAVSPAHDEWVNRILGINPAAFAGPADNAGPTATPQNAPVTATQPAPPNQSLFLNETGDTKPISESDIHQGQLGDCFLLSSMGEIARINPDIIRRMIKDNGNGTYTVTLHKRKGGAGQFFAGLFGATPEFEEIKVTVDSNFPQQNVADHGSANQQPTEDVVGGKKEIWVQVLEKAYAQVTGGYAGITKGGWANNAMETLTGQEATQQSVSGLFGGISLNDLSQAFRARKPIVLNTLDRDNLPFNLVKDHAYMVEDVKVAPDGKGTLILRNPWGDRRTDQPPQPVPFDQLSKGFDTVDIGGTLPAPPPATAPAPTP